MKVEMEGEKERRARHRDKNQSFAEDSQALDQIAKQVQLNYIGDTKTSKTEWYIKLIIQSWVHKENGKLIIRSVRPALPNQLAG